MALPLIELEELTYQQFMARHDHDTEILHSFLLFMNKRRREIRALENEANQELIILRTRFYSERSELGILAGQAS